MIYYLIDSSGFSLKPIYFGNLFTFAKWCSIQNIQILPWPSCNGKICIINVVSDFPVFFTKKYKFLFVALDQIVKNLSKYSHSKRKNSPWPPSENIFPENILLNRERMIIILLLSLAKNFKKTI